MSGADGTPSGKSHPVAETGPVREAADKPPIIAALMPGTDLVSMIEAAVTEKLPAKISGTNVSYRHGDP